MELGKEFDEATVSLRIFGDDLNPEEISRMLNCEPTEAYRKGYVITTTMRPRTVRTGQWFLSVKRNALQTIEEQILELFAKLPQDLTVWNDLHKSFDVDIYCGAWLNGWNRDVFFSPNLLRQMSDRQLQIGIAIYCDCDDEGVKTSTEKLNETAHESET